MTLLIDRDFCTTLAIALGHFLWQGAAAAAVTLLIARQCGSAHSRYRVFVTGLLAMALCVPVTLLVAGSSRSATATRERALAAASHRDSAFDPTGEPAIAAQSIPDALPSTTSLEAQKRFEPAESAATTSAAARIEAAWARFIPFVTAAYLLGVLLMLLRLMRGLWGGWRLRRAARAIENAILLDALARQARRLRMKSVPWLAYCEQVGAPTVIGIIKPTILLPWAIASRLSPEQLESVLAHELAHLKRYDHLVNLLQRVIESLLFFHPAVWWISRRIRTERENCCDDLVVACGASPLHYATSLLRVAELCRRPRPRTSLAALGLSATEGKPSTLRRRISRLLGDSADTPVKLGRRWPAVGIAAALLAVILGLYRIGGQSIAAHPEPDDAALIAEWVAVVDADVLAELKKLPRRSGDVPHGDGYESFRCSADELRAALKPYLGRKKKLDIPRALRFMTLPEPAFRTSGLAYSCIASWMQRQDAQGLSFIPITLSVAGTYFAAAQRDDVYLKVDFSSLSATLGGWQANAQLEFETKLANDEAVATIFKAEPLGDWKPSLLLVHEVVRVDIDDVSAYQLLDRLEDWIRFGKASRAEEAAQMRKWQRQARRLSSQVDSKWTRNAPENGGKFELVALSRPRIAPGICWAPTGQPVDPKPYWLTNSQCESDELIAFVRVWEPGRPRSSRKWGDLTESTAALGAQLGIIQGVDANKFKVGAGFGPWTDHVDLAAKENAAALGDAEFGISKIHDHGAKACVFVHLRSHSARTIRDLWLVAVTKSGKSIEPNADTEPQIYSDDKHQPPCTFWFDHPAADIDHFVLESRPIQWVEFAGFPSAPPTAKPSSSSSR